MGKVEVNDILVMYAKEVLPDAKIGYANLGFFIELSGEYTLNIITVYVPKIHMILSGYENSDFSSDEWFGEMDLNDPNFKEWFKKRLEKAEILARPGLDGLRPPGI